MAFSPRTTDEAVTPRLAILTWIASKLNGVTEQELPDWTTGLLGRRLEGADLRPHVVQLRPPTRRGRPTTGSRPRLRPIRRPAIFDWLLVEETPELNLISLLVELPNPTFEQRPSLVADLESLPGIRHVVEMREDGDVYALATVRNLTEADVLQARVQELVSAGGVRVRRIKRESQQGAKRTWRELAVREAADEESP